MNEGVVYKNSHALPVIFPVTSLIIMPMMN